MDRQGVSVRLPFRGLSAGLALGAAEPLGRPYSQSRVGGPWESRGPFQIAQVAAVRGQARPPRARGQQAEGALGADWGTEIGPSDEEGG